MIRTFSLIWAVAMVLAGAGVFYLQSADLDSEEALPQRYLPSLAGADVIFIGSSLTGSALSADWLDNGPFGSGASVRLISAPAISERLSNRALDHALGSGAGTIAVEINAYSLEIAPLNEPAFLNHFGFWLQGLGKRTALNVRELIGIGIDPAQRLHSRFPGPTDQTFDGDSATDANYYRLVKWSPQREAELRALAQRAARSKVELLLVSPPRPRSAIERMGEQTYVDLLEHQREIANRYQLPLWSPAEPWPDDHFIDLLAHANSRGRARFLREFVQWHEALP